MEGIKICPLCGGELEERKVEEIFREGNNAIVITLKAKVCLKCGERLYGPEDIEMFEKLREKLKQGKIEDFKPMGTLYRVAA